MNGIRQLNINVPDDDQARGDFSALATAVRNDSIDINHIAFIADSPAHTNLAVKFSTILQENSFRSLVFKMVAKIFQLI